MPKKMMLQPMVLLLTCFLLVCGLLSSDHTKAESVSNMQIYVDKVVTNVSEILTVEELEEITRSIQGKTVEISEILEAVSSINELYASKGYVTARALLPAQEVHEGVVYIQLVEGRLGKLVLMGNESTAEQYILNRVSFTSGDLVRLDVLEDELLYFNQTNDVQLRGELSPGADFGTTDITLVVSEQPKIKGTMFVDSGGRKDSGRFRSGVSMVNESLFGHRDPLNLSVTKAPGSLSAMASYNFSLNPQGSRVGWRFDTSSMKIIHGEYESLDIRAHNVGQALTFTTPIRVEPQNLVDGFLEYRWKTARTFFSGVELLKNQTTTMVAGWNTKRQISSGLYNSTQALTIGYGDAAEDKIFAKFNGTYNWLLAHGAANEVRLQTMFQVSPNHFLPPDEQFAVGGVNTVRAFEEGQLTGDSGYTFSLEYNIALHEAIDLSVFLDHGAAFPYKGDDEPINENDFLTGTGVGLTVRFSDNLWWRIQAGLPLMPKSPVRAHALVQWSF